MSIDLRFLGPANAKSVCHVSFFLAVASSRMLEEVSLSPHSREVMGRLSKFLYFHCLSHSQLRKPDVFAWGVRARAPLLLPGNQQI